MSYIPKFIDTSFISDIVFLTSSPKSLGKALIVYCILFLTPSSRVLGWFISTLVLSSKVVEFSH